MPAILLFCLAEEANKLNLSTGKREKLIEDYSPSDGQEFKDELKADETFETDFIGASEQDCQKWVLEKQSQDNKIEQDLIAIADSQTARDDTLLMQHYIGESNLEFGEWGVLPREEYTWHDFRIDYREAKDVYASLQFGALDCVYLVYFGRREELTDQRGVFDVAKAERIVSGKDPEKPDPFEKPYHPTSS